MKRTATDESVGMLLICETNDTETSKFDPGPTSSMFSLQTESFLFVCRRFYESDSSFQEQTATLSSSSVSVVWSSASRLRQDVTGADSDARGVFY